MVVDRLLGNPLEAVVPRTFQGLYRPLFTVSYKPQSSSVPTSICVYSKTTSFLGLFICSA